MRELFRLALGRTAYKRLMAVILCCMLFMVLASRAEIFAIRILSDSGPSFFQLFGEDSHFTESVSFDSVKNKWVDYTGGLDKPMTKEAQSAAIQGKDSDLIGKAVIWVDRNLQLRSNLWNLAYLLLGIALMRCVSTFGFGYLRGVLSVRVARDLRLRYFEHIQKMPMHFYHRYNIGALSTRVVTDAQVVADGLFIILNLFLQAPLMIGASFVLCLMTSWRLTAILFLGFPLVVVPLALLAQQVRKVARRMQKNQESFASVLIDFISGIQTIKIFAIEGYSLDKYKEQNDYMAFLGQRNALYSQSVSPLMHFVGTILLCTIVVYAAAVEQMSFGAILFYCGILLSFYEPVRKYSEQIAEMQKAIVAAERMNEVLKQDASIQDKEGAKELKSERMSVAFKNVSFSYDEKDYVLHDLSFTAEPGQKIALVGPTGAGKSTVAQLLCRLYEVQKGEIAINGTPLDGYTQQSLREAIAFVPQKPFLFFDTIAQNIAFGGLHTKEEIIEAAKRAHAHEFITELPDGYDHVLAQGQHTLSGGQAQRLAIARALLKRSSLLVMDEATSALDTVSEDKIKQAISKLRGGVTQIIIAHRLSTIEDADKIIYIEKGRKLAEGTKDELLLSCPGFKLMWDMMHKKDA